MGSIAEILQNHNSVPATAEALLEAGYHPVPIPPGIKGPQITEWEQKDFTAASFRPGMNIGLHHRNIAAVDRDCPESYALRDRFLPPTFRTGHGDTPESHSWYDVEGAPPLLQLKDGVMMVELRYGQGKQTVIPPSVHPSGEAYAAGNDLPIATISAEELVRGVRMEAAAALIARHYAPPGGQYNFGLYLAGYLLRHDVSEEDAFELMMAAKEIQPEGVDKHAAKNIMGVISSTAKRLARKEKDVAGGKKLAKEYSKELVSQLPNVLGWEEEKAVDPEVAAAEAWPVCADLAQRENITADFAATLHARGVAGESNQIRFLYLAVMSRRLARPVNVAVKGPSSGGKSYLVEQVLEAFPESSYYALSSMSEKALIYLDEDMRHRFLVIYEASGMAGDMQTYLIRTLLSEGMIRYQTAEATKDGVKPRLLEMEGPTGLIVTTTQTRMHAENETRLFSLLVTDSRKQTADILMAMADEDREPVSMDAWRALQTWIEGQPCEVYIPYSKELAGLVPPVAVRLRRDFMAVLQLIRSHAVLHQATRERDAKGRIVATFEDYAVIRELVADMVAEGVDATVPETVRETVLKVKELTTEADEAYVGMRKLAQALELDRSATSRRWLHAKDAGHLKNLEDGKGKAAKIALGEPLPADVEILPTVEALERVCTCASPSEGIPTPDENKHTSCARPFAHPLHTPPPAEGFADAVRTIRRQNESETLQEHYTRASENGKAGEGGIELAQVHTPHAESENSSAPLAQGRSVHRSEDNGELSPSARAALWGLEGLGGNATGLNWLEQVVEFNDLTNKEFDDALDELTEAGVVRFEDGEYHYA
jgi:hypothetical protein